MLTQPLLSDMVTELLTKAKRLYIKRSVSEGQTADCKCQSQSLNAQDI